MYVRNPDHDNSRNAAIAAAEVEGKCVELWLAEVAIDHGTEMINQAETLLAEKTSLLKELRASCLRLWGCVHP